MVGTKTEMERLLKDAEKITGIKYDISNLSDVYEAIHVIQGELGITGSGSLVLIKPPLIFTSSSQSSNG